MRLELRMFNVLEVVKADFKAAARRVEELMFLFVAALAAGVVGSYAGRYAVFLVAFLASQLSAYLYVIRDWDRGVLEGLVYYAGHSGVYVSKLVVTSALSTASTALSSLFIDLSLVPLAVAAAFLMSTLAALAALFAVYGGLPPPAATAMAAVLALPPLAMVVEGAPAWLAAVFTTAIGIVVAGLLDRL